MFSVRKPLAYRTDRERKDKNRNSQYPCAVPEVVKGNRTVRKIERPKNTPLEVGYKDMGLGFHFTLALVPRTERYVRCKYIPELAPQVEYPAHRRLDTPGRTMETITHRGCIA
jgi:hypothetical protein